MIRIGSKVKFNNKGKLKAPIEDEDRIFEVRSNPFEMSDTMCVLLKGEVGGYAVDELMEIEEKQENTDKLIDGNKLLEAIEKHSYLVTYGRNSQEKGMTLTGIKQAIDEQIKCGEWILCKDRTPTKEECGLYGKKTFLVTVLADKLKTLVMDYEYTTVRGKEVSRWLWNDRVNIDWEVIAWQPLPKPYQEEQEVAE